MRKLEGGSTRRQRRKHVKKLQKVKVVENQKHGQNDVDNHTGQNYNVKHF